MDDIEAVGLGSPGTIDSERGVVVYSNNLDFENVPAGDILERELSKRVYAENDANAAAYGEFVAGSAKGVRNAVCITLGTGVGGGIIIDGKIYSGFNFAGAELGHTVIEVDGPTCTCGRKGCFEVFSSATGLIRMTKEAMAADPSSKMHGMVKDKVDARLAFDAMRAGDVSAKPLSTSISSILRQESRTSSTFPAGDTLHRRWSMQRGRRFASALEGACFPRNIHPRRS